jgi:hypothetical protein
LIGRDELRRVLDNYCYVMNDVQFDELMNMIDTDRDGNISYEEFMAKIGSEISYSGPQRRSSVQQGRGGQGGGGGGGDGGGGMWRGGKSFSGPSDGGGGVMGRPPVRVPAQQQARIGSNITFG